MLSALFGSRSGPTRRLSDLPDPPPREWSRWWLPGLIAGSASIVALLVLPVDTPVRDFLFLVSALVGLVVLLGATLTLNARARPTWWALLAFQLLAMSAVAVETVSVSQTGTLTFPNLADAVSLAAYLPAFVALGLLIHRSYPGRDREAWIDATILTVTAACVFGLFLIGPLGGSDLQGFPLVVALSYPVLDLALLSALVWLLVGSSRPSLTLALIAVSIMITLAAAVARDALLVSSMSVVANNGWLQVLRLASLLVMAAAAWTPTAASVAQPQQRAPRRSSTPRLAVLAIGVLTVPAILVSRLLGSKDSATLLLALAGMIVIILAVWRIQILVTAVERQREVTSLILDSAGDGIVGLDREGFVLFANLSARKLLRCREADMIGHRFHDLAHHERSDGTPFPWQECAIHSAISNGSASYFGGERYVRRDGTTFPVEIVMSPLVIDGAVMGAVQSFRNVSEREEVDVMKRQFVSVVSHELRTPLTSIKGSLQMLDSGIVGALTEDQQELVSMAVANSERLGNLVNDILDLERLESGRMVLSPVHVPANAIAEQAVNGIAGAASAAGIELAVELDPGDTEINADPDRLVQVLTNLLGNAIKFSERGATVRTTVRRLDDAVTLSISDSGRGIPADQLETVFERFGQVDAGDARRESGTGLGLAIARDLVQLSGGDITVDSTTGEGSTFTVTLPAARHDDDGEMPLGQEVLS